MQMKLRPTFMPLREFEYVAPMEMLARAVRFNALVQRRRTVRMFSDRPTTIRMNQSASRPAYCWLGETDTSIVMMSFLSFVARVPMSRSSA